MANSLVDVVEEFIPAIFPVEPGHARIKMKGLKDYLVVATAEDLSHMEGKLAFVSFGGTSEEHPLNHLSNRYETNEISEIELYHDQRRLIIPPLSVYQRVD